MALLPPLLLQRHAAQDLWGFDLSGNGVAEGEPSLPLQVDRLDSLRASGPLTIARMIKNCGPQIFACVNDPECKAALDCLQACSATDQVMHTSCLHCSIGTAGMHAPKILQAWGQQLTATQLNTAGPFSLATTSALQIGILICVVADPQVCSYRCIVSHESQLLEDFSLCVLQKHNCMGKSAEIPALPDPPPMAAFRGEDLTHELAESLFIGWLGGLCHQTSLQDAQRPIRTP